MKTEELFNICSAFLDDYLSGNIPEIHAALFDGAKNTNDINEAMWKNAIDSLRASCRISVMSTIAILINLGVLHVDDADTPILPNNQGFLS